MQTKQKINKCRYCGYYEAYYTKGLNRFINTKQGYCCECKKIVDKDFQCELWIPNRRKWISRNKSISRALYEILMDLSAIRQIMQENEEDINYDK